MLAFTKLMSLQISCLMLSKTCLFEAAAFLRVPDAAEREDNWGVLTSLEDFLLTPKGEKTYCYLLASFLRWFRFM